MADEKDFAKELNALIKRCVDGGCDPRTSLTNCYQKQIPCSATTTSKYLEGKPAGFGPVALNACALA